MKDIYNIINNMDVQKIAAGLYDAAADPDNTEYNSENSERDIKDISNALQYIISMANSPAHCCGEDNARQFATLCAALSYAFEV